MIFLILIILLVYLVIILSVLSNESTIVYEYIIILLISVLGSIFLLISNDMLSFYLSVELQSLCYYILVSFRTNVDFSIEAGLKYFVLSSFISCILLLGIVFVYGFSGLINFLDIQYLFYDSIFLSFNEVGVGIGFILVMFSLLFKLGIVPLHMWLIDVYSGSSLYVLFYFLIIPKITIIFIFFKLYYLSLYVFIDEWYFLLGIMGGLSVFISIGGIGQYNIKRLLSYSTISHSGMILLCYISNTIEGIEGVFVYLLIYIIININLFSGIFLCKTLIGDYLVNMGMLSTLISNFRDRPIIYGFTFLMFSLAGIPPFLGFYSKILVYFSMVKSGFFIQTLIIMMFSLFSVAYYLRIIRVLNFNNDKKYVMYIFRSNTLLYIFIISSIFNIYLSMFIGEFYEFIGVLLYSNGLLL